VGKVAAIGSGPHEGLYARVIQEISGDEVAVRLLASEEDVVVAKSDLNFSVLTNNLPSNHPAKKYLSKKEEGGEEGEGEDKSHSSSKSSRSKHESKHRSEDGSTKSKSKSGPDSDHHHHHSSSSWLYPQIMVRLISKKSHFEKYYNKKGHIIDVVGRDNCTVQLLDGTLVDGLSQHSLQTVIPKPGGAVMILHGANKGARGTLLERKKKDNNSEVALIKLFSDFSISTYDLNDISEYVDNGDVNM